ncbi:acyl-CoA carboxylase epsilon subunit [Cellulomonas sp. NPDC057328]|uniref:acyl-CoA carboxylase epsilon subunit n=1 Tax=Cellulomonas sp. NPDC057328 TaxID=3346101 RepID=UPI00363F064E
MSAPTDGPAGPAARGDAHVQVVRGTPDDVELAALVAGLVAAASGHDGADGAHAHDRDDADRAARARWTAPGRLRGTVPPVRGADAWRWSLHP